MSNGDAVLILTLVCFLMFSWFHRAPEVNNNQQRYSLNVHKSDVQTTTTDCKDNDNLDLQDILDQATRPKPCHEKLNVGTPRTICSTRSKFEYNQWWLVHRTNMMNGAKMATTIDFQNDDGLILFGDSITEMWMGTSYGGYSKRSEGMYDKLTQEKVFNGLVSGNVPHPLVLGISGDKVQHLIFRMNELYPFCNSPRWKVSILIGVNNLLRKDSPEDVFEGIKALVQAVLDECEVKVLLNYILPVSVASSEAIFAVNKMLQEWYDTKMKSKYADRLVLLDCTTPFMDNGSVIDGMFADGLHPNVKGAEAFAKCVVDLGAAI